jgi:hypothetical protein
LDTTTGIITPVTSPNPVTPGNFGHAVAISGNTIVVGAPFETSGTTGYEGHAYVFDATTGALVSTVTSPNPQYAGNFGRSVAISGNTIVVGAPFEAFGNAYVFDATTGALVSTLNSGYVFGGEFGTSVAISGTTVVVGAPFASSGTTAAAGNAYVFDATDGSLITTLTSPNAQHDGSFGQSVSISGTAVVVGAPDEMANVLSKAGHAYVFDASTGSPIASLTSPYAQAGGEFGISVSVSCTTVVVGANLETANGQTGAGHAYSFDATTGFLTTTLTSPNAQTNGAFGFSVAVGGTTVVVGAPPETGSGFTGAGHAYIFP